MSPLVAVLLVLVLGSTCYAAGRLHGQLSYRIGYRFGYRQGYFDGDRGAWNRRRDAQAVLASAFTRPAPAPVTAPATRAAVPFAGTTAPAAVTARPASGPMSRATATAQLGGLATRQGTTYTGSSFAAAGAAGGPQTGTLVRRPG